MSNLNDALNIPIIKTESKNSIDCKMLNTIIFSTIIVLLLYYICLQNNKLNLQKSDIYTEYMTDVTPANNEPVIGKYIQITNNNKKYIPINKIIIIDINRKVIPIFNKNANMMKLGKNGIIIEYTLPKLINIAQIIIDIDLFDKRSENIVTSQVRIRDNDYDTLWTNKKPLKLGRSKYIELTIKHPTYIYPIPQQKLNNNLTGIQQDDRLNFNLLENTWS
jgi:hypothetical protein